jgi:hypothetical protein
MNPVIIFVAIWLLLMWLLPNRVAKIISNIARIGSIVLVVLANGYVAFFTLNYVWLAPIAWLDWIITTLSLIIAFVWTGLVGWVILWSYRKYISYQGKENEKCISN